MAAVAQRKGGGNPIPVHVGICLPHLLCAPATGLARVPGLLLRAAEERQGFRRKLSIPSIRVQFVSLCEPIVSAPNLRLHIATPPFEGRSGASP
jgi:hypothetical protein